MELIPVTADSLNGLNALHLAKHDLSLVVLPGLGAKIASLRWHETELLAQNPYQPLRPARYGAPYAEFDASGFDECLPTIGACPYPEAPWQSVEAPDHGELWSLPWLWQGEGDELHTWVQSVRFAYDFHRWLSVPAPGCVRLRYALTNHAPQLFKFLWSAHPLFAPQPGMRIVLPEGVRVRVDWSRDERLGGLLAEHPWPHTQDRAGRAVDLSLVLPAKAGLVDKLYTTRLSDGWCALHDPETGRYVAFVFDAAQIPYVGLSINFGGWPIDGPGYYNVGLEPCTGYPDRLDVAIARGDHRRAPPGERLTWEMDLRVGVTPDLPAEIRRLRQGQSSA